MSMTLSFNMEYFSINDSLNKKEVGIYPQVEKAVYTCDVEDPKFIDRIEFSKANFDPIVAKAVLKKQAKVSDLVSAGIIGFNLKLLISDKLKDILHNSRKSGLQFFRSPIIYENAEIENYWILNFYEIDMAFIDYANSDIFLTEYVFNHVQKLEIGSYDEYLLKKQEIQEKGYPYGIRIERISLIEDISQDFFALLDVMGGVKYVVSERLKSEIEIAGCTGIEFMPIELTLNEWLQGGKREKIYGKA